MNKIYYLYCFLWVFLCAYHTQAQTLNTKRALKELDGMLQELNFHDAIPLAEAIVKQEPENKDGNLKLGFAYINSISKEKSLKYFKKVYDIEKEYLGNLPDLCNNSPKLLCVLEHYLANAYHYNNKFHEAVRFFEKAQRNYEKSKQEHRKDDEIGKLLDDKIKECKKKLIDCKNGEKFIAQPVNAEITNIGNIVNGKYSDYAPVISADEHIMVFTSRREGSTGGKRDVDGDFFEDIYEVIKDKETKQWSKPRNIGSPVNTKFHDATIAISPDGKQLFVYKDNSAGTGDIYYTIRNSNGSYDELKSMGKNINTSYHETSISITVDYKTVYFSSNRPGGFGGLDIYKSEKNAKGEWGEAVNLGKEINTEYDDDAPFISFDGKHLYFSSEGHETMGGYDIFKTSWENNKWTKPDNLGYPINTADNDLYFVLSADEKTGYYASAKEGGFGYKDIYMIKMPEIKVIEVKKVEKPIEVTFKPTKIEFARLPDKPRLLLRGTIRDKQTQEVLEANLDINLLLTYDLIQSLKSDKEKGTYSTTKVQWDNTYILSAQKEGYLFNSISFVIPPETPMNQEIVVDLELERLKVGAKINLVIFYDFDKATLRPESNTELKRLLAFMQKYPGVSVEIAGHTDNIGTEQRNQILSEQRAKSVVNFLLKNDIPERRLTYNGYGFNKPVAPNRKKNGEDDPEGRQKNRRTECIVTAVK